MKLHSILVVDDEPSMRELIEFNLCREGYNVVCAADGDAALREFERGEFSLVILDIMMPGRDGFSVCGEIRKKSSVPVIMLTAKTAEASKVAGLELGADDYVTKPFSVAELTARVRANIRRAEAYSPAATPAGDGDEIIECGGLKIDRARREVKVRGANAELTTREFDLLFFLASNPGIVFTREQILDRVWGGESVVVDRAVDVHVRHLREKIEADSEKPEFMLTVRGVGYRFAKSGVRK